MIELIRIIIVLVVAAVDIALLIRALVEAIV